MEEWQRFFNRLYIGLGLRIYKGGRISRLDHASRHQSLSPRAHRLVAPWSLQGAQMEEKSSRPFANGTFYLQGVQLDSCCGHLFDERFRVRLDLERSGFNVWYWMQT